MTKKVKDILITLGFAISAIICITSDIPIVTYIAFLSFVVFIPLWITKTNNGRKVYNNFLNAIGKDE